MNKRFLFMTQRLVKSQPPEAWEMARVALAFDQPCSLLLLDPFASVDRAIPSVVMNALQQLFDEGLERLYVCGDGSSFSGLSAQPVAKSQLPSLLAAFDVHVPS